MNDQNNKRLQLHHSMALGGGKIAESAGKCNDISLFSDRIAQMTIELSLAYCSTKQTQALPCLVEWERGVTCDGALDPGFAARAAPVEVGPLETAAAAAVVKAETLV